jgi:hypothetical protein
MDERLLNELLALQQKDVETRSRLLKEGRLYGAYAEEMQRVHRENAERLNALVELHGWPGVSLVGLEGSRAAWLVAQHSLCTPALQRKFRDLLERASATGEAPKRQVAMLTDRVLFNEGKPQVYGCVLDWDERARRREKTRGRLAAARGAHKTGTGSGPRRRCDTSHGLRCPPQEERRMGTQCRLALNS